MAEVSYTFDATAGQIATLSFNEAGTDPDRRVAIEGRLVSPGGTVVGQPFDGEINGNGVGVGTAFVSDMLPETGTYELFLFDRDSTSNINGAGNLVISLAVGGTPPVADGNASGNDPNLTLVSGQSVLATLSDGDLDVFSFDADAGETATISFSELGDPSNAVALAFQVFAPDGTRVADVVDGEINGNGTGRGTAFVSDPLPQDGTYQIVFRDRDSNSNVDDAGDYRLSLVVGNGAVLDDGGEGDDPNLMLVSGGTVEFTVDSGDLDVFSFDATSGDRATFAISERFDTDNLVATGSQLFAPDGSLVGDFFDGEINGNGLGLGASFVTDPLPATGTYQLVVRDRDNQLNADNAGSLTLSFALGSVLPTDVGLDASDPNPRVDEAIPFTTTLFDGDVDVFVFEASAGDAMQIVADEQGRDPESVIALAGQLFAPDGTRIADVLDGELNGNGRGQTIDFTIDPLPADGTYLFVVRDRDNQFQSPDASEYTVTITGITPPEPTNQPPTIGSLVASPNPAKVSSPVTLELLSVEDLDGEVTSVEFFLKDNTSNFRFSIGIDTDGSDGWFVETLAPDDFFGNGDPDGFAGARDFIAVARDDDGLLSEEATTRLGVFVIDNLPPTIEALTASPEPVVQGNTLTLTPIGIVDEQDPIARLTFFRDGMKIADSVDGDNGFTLDVDTTDLSPGVYTFSVVAADPQRLESEPRFVTSTVIAPPPPPPTDDLAFTFLDATADVRLFQIEDGATYARSELASNLSVEVDNVDAEAESVAWRLEGPGGLVYENTENISFYTLFRNLGTAYEGSADVLGGELPAGTYTLSATSYSADDAEGSVDEMSTITFTIADDATVPTIDGLTVVDADRDVTAFDLVDGGVYSVFEVPTSATIVAAASESESVAFELDGPDGLSVSSVENVSPYSIFANDGNDFFGGSLPAGDYTLSVTPWSQDGATGTAGSTRVLSFSIVEFQAR